MTISVESGKLVRPDSKVDSKYRKIYRYLYLK